MKEIIKKILPSFIVSWYHFLLAFFGAVFYGFPSKKIKVIGVTGTNGKTTVVNMATEILEKAGYKVASISSIKFKIKEKERPNMLKMTMPGRFKIQKFLREALNLGCQYAVLEVSSEGIKQHRHRFIDFSVAVFTNLSPEHIESHKGFENYRAAKEKLFKSTKKIHIVNIDDKNSAYFLKFPAQKTYTFGLERGDINKNNTSFKLLMLGEFNKYNALAAITIGLSQGVSLAVCQKGVEEFKGLPGRMEIVVENPFKAVIDYAVTPDALEGLYKTLKTEFSPKNLICVFGACGGGRDKWKRKELGKIAQNYCNKIILTNEDPYNEDPREIIKQISVGIKKEYEEILDREMAIKRALELALIGDVIAITGKGSEPQMALAKGKKIPWSDKETVKRNFNNLKK
jgi:UDP-N-acetylmuramoyl-L-alanyl-D-glutamate--2,6-diaminopimelate ligase